jgi:hypothetical protein
LIEWAKAWAQTAPWKPEPGAQLSMLRWKSFVQAEDDEFVRLMEAFTKATGVKVTISRESFEDVQPEAAVAANTGSGPNLFWGLYSRESPSARTCRASGRSSLVASEPLGAAGSPGAAVQCVVSPGPAPSTVFAVDSRRACTAR